MASTEHTVPATQRQRRSRKSIAHMPSPEKPYIMGDKENRTVDISSLTSADTSTAPAGKSSRKKRSKSIGPGGLNESTGNRRKSAAPINVKSILKPTIPLSPLQEIPTLAASRKAAKGKNATESAKTSTVTSAPFDNLYPTLPGAVNGDGASALTPPLSGLADPFTGTPVRAGETKISLRTEEEQQAAAREREEKEKRELEKKDILERRDARRKSLANRRVSFAPEATLHTWDVVEYFQDSTTSSASTNSTRRASAMSAASSAPQSPAPSSDPSEPPSTPPEQVENEAAVLSPAPQRQLHQKKRRRRSSAVPPMNFNNPDDETDLSSSPFSGDDDTGNQTFVTANGDNKSSSSGSDSDDDGDSTMMSLDDGDTMQSAHSRRSSGSSTNSSGRLDEALRLAAQQAGTQGIEHDEHGDLTMEMADDEITAAFQPWVKKNAAAKNLQDLTSFGDQENQNPFSRAFKAGTENKLTGTSPNDDDEATMDMTVAVGSIIQAQNEKTVGCKRRKSVAPSRRRSSVGRRRSSGEGSSLGDETMDFTMAVGSIQPSNQQASKSPVDDSMIDDAEDMTMELTAVIGSLLPPLPETNKRRRSSASRQLLQEGRRRESMASPDDELDMDVTMAIGGILASSNDEEAHDEDDWTMPMDVTTALGGILPVATRSQAKAVMERETDIGELASSPFQAEVPAISPPKSAVSAIASATGSPSLSTVKGKAANRRSNGGRLSATPNSAKKRSLLPGEPTTPSKQLTPEPPKPTTPSKTPTPKSVAFRSASPKRLFKDAIKNAASTPKTTTPKPKNIFMQDGKTGAITPSIILTPRPRQSSGLGIDREGLGSPRIAALLDRRRSIGDEAKAFVPSFGEGPSRGVRFEDPRAMESEFEKEKEEEEQREALRNRVDDEKDVTVNLREMIESLTPKKNKLKGRKSLAVGAARGLLGKRPAELDEEEDESDRSAKKAKITRNPSPVKSVRLPPPPSKVETTGRITRRSLNAPSGNIQSATSSPVKGQGKATATEAVHGDSVALNDEEAEEEEVEERIHLQDFLNLTSIRFMELNTTKRRYTVAPNALVEGSAKKAPTPAGNNAEDNSSTSLESCVVAGACTVPMLELYQHSCHELKRYISEGRRIVREIEADTFEENPPLFQEYITATPDVKYIMDNQFKNVKTHARLLSKAMWYEWRMGLLSGLQEGLDKAKQGMEADEVVLKQQEALLEPLVPSLIAEFEKLQAEQELLQAQADELANCDQEEVQAARDELAAIEAEIEAKQKTVQEMQAQVKEKEERIEMVIERIDECKKEIAEAERVREECRGWSASEVQALKDKADDLEKKYGWTITSASGTSLTMTYRREIQLVFDVASLLPNDGSRLALKSENSAIDISYIADQCEYHSQPLTPCKSFVLANLHARLTSLRQSATKLKDFLAVVSDAWEKSTALTEEIRQLTLFCPTETAISSEDGSRLVARASLLLPQKATKIEVAFEVRCIGEGAGSSLLMNMSVEPRARVVYGERFHEKNIGEMLRGRVKGILEGGRQGGGWGTAVRELWERLAGGKGRKV